MEKGMGQVIDTGTEIYQAQDIRKSMDCPIYSFVPFYPKISERNYSTINFRLDNVLKWDVGQILIKNFKNEIE